MFLLALKTILYDLRFKKIRFLSKNLKFFSFFSKIFTRYI